MLSLDDIKKLTGIEDAEITKIEENGCKLHIHVEKKRSMQKCPQCGRLTDKVHDYRIQTVKDIDCFSHAVVLVVRKRRYRCQCNKCFDERYSFLPRYYRMTRRLVARVIEQLSHSVTYSYVARQTGLSVTTVIRIFDSIAYPQPNCLSKTVAIDEFRGNLGGEKYQCILTDVENGKVLDILPCRTGYMLSQYLPLFATQLCQRGNITNGVVFGVELFSTWEICQEVKVLQAAMEQRNLLDMGHGGECSCLHGGVIRKV